MPIKRKITEPDGIYFITFTCFKWLSLISQTNSHDLVYTWFDYLKSWGHYINGFVIMPNHLHALIAFRNTGKLINTLVGNGKMIMGKSILSRLEEQKNDELLSYLNSQVTKKGLRNNKKHEIWEQSFDWKECRTHKFIQQKLNYMHENPCKGKWDLAIAPSDYKHSSARFYICGEHAGYPVTNYLELDDVDLTTRLGDWRPNNF